MKKRNFDDYLLMIILLFLLVIIVLMVKDFKSGVNFSPGIMEDSGGVYFWIILGILAFFALLIVVLIFLSEVQNHQTDYQRAYDKHREV